MKKKNENEKVADLLSAKAQKISGLSERFLTETGEVAGRSGDLDGRRRTSQSPIHGNYI